MPNNNSIGRHRSTARHLGTIALAAVVMTPLACANPFDTSVDNPNAVVETALADAAGATTLVNGQGAAVTRALTAILAPYSVATDELTWVGSREFWKTLDDGDLSDPVNEYTDGAFPFVTEARWLSNFAIERVALFDSAGTLRNRRDIARSNIFGAIIYITIGDMFDDFILGSSRFVATGPVGTANMPIFYDSAVAMLDRALPVAATLADLELQRQILGLRARAKFSKASRATVFPSRAVPGNPLVNDAGAVADANAMLALGPTGTSPSWRYLLTPTANNLASINLGFELNNRGELRAGDTFVIPDPARPIVPLDGSAGIRMIDPVTGVASSWIAAVINECCRPNVGNNIPMTVVSAREMYLIRAESRLAAADNAGFLTNINLARAASGLPPYPDATGANAKLEYERKTQLYLQGRRLMDMYRFNVADSRWLTGNGARSRCLLPITYIERLANTQAPQPANARLCQ